MHYLVKGGKNLSNKHMKITDTEMEVMKEIWNCNTMVTISELTTRFNEKGKLWAYQTIAIFLKKLETKEMIDSSKKGKILYYFPLISEEEYKNNKARNFINMNFNGSLKNFLTAFSLDSNLIKKDRKDLKEWFDSIDK